MSLFSEYPRPWKVAESQVRDGVAWIQASDGRTLCELMTGHAHELVQLINGLDDVSVGANAVLVALRDIAAGELSMEAVANQLARTVNEMSGGKA